MTYRPIVIDVTQSQYGYWLVTISVAPGRRLTVMMAALGISPEDAARSALGGAWPGLTPQEAQ